MAEPGLVFLLDTPNVWRGRGLAGTPARMLALAEHCQRAGTTATLVLCDRGADYGSSADWPMNVLLAHPQDFYLPSRLAKEIDSIPIDYLVLCEAESVCAYGRELATRLDARLVYDVHDDEAKLAHSLKESSEQVTRYGATQRQALRVADIVIVLTLGEAELTLSAGVPDSRITLLPNGADRQRRHWGPNNLARRLVFVGNLFYEPNAQALSMLRESILPKLRADGSDTRLRVIGRGPARLTAPGVGVEVLGPVASIDHALSGCTVGLAPLTAGSGAKMKVLDYMAAGLPVVGTSEAVTGLPASHPGVVVEDDLDRWPSLLAALLADPAALRELGYAGRRCVERQLSWQRIGGELADHARVWLKTPARRRSSVLPRMVVRSRAG